MDGSEALNFLLPAMVANLFLYLLSVRFGKTIGPPLDLGSELVGPSRSFIGLPACLASGLFVGALQHRIDEALILVIGVEVGTVVHSFIKRRKGLKPGDKHSPWDHVDYVLGALFAYASCHSISFVEAASYLVWGGLFHWAGSQVLRPLLDSKSENG